MMHFPTEKSFVGKVFFLPFNRDAKAMKELAKNMRKDGFTQPIMLIKTDVIDGVMRIYVADGQHRALTALAMGIPFRGELLPNEFKTREEAVLFVARHNSSQRSWTVSDYVKAFSSVGSSVYLRLIDIRKKTPFTFTTLAAMLDGANKRSTSNPDLKDGTFKINREKETLRTLDYAKELGEFRQLTNRMVLSLHRVMSLKIFKKDKFTEAYKKYAKELNKLELDRFDDLFVSWLK